MSKLEKPSWTVITIQKHVLRRIHSFKAHPKQTNSEVIEILLDYWDVNQKKLKKSGVIHRCNTATKEKRG